MFDENKKKKVIDYFHKELFRRFESEKYLKNFKCYQEMREICLEMCIEECQKAQGKLNPIATTYKEAETRYYEEITSEFTICLINYSLMQVNNNIKKYLILEISEQYKAIISRANRDYLLRILS